MPRAVRLALCLRGMRVCVLQRITRLFTPEIIGKSLD